ncbi:3'-5' exonuclease [Rhodoferax sp.]|uniref:3'-5' exonuclease n=1 Tax=Rhodoferax sp. TaxID=50421 RepID=UPI0025DA11B7|nr:3'-5' exonuclease [Rhodoferax sp.]
MATLIPTLGSCVSRMTGGERKLAERLEQKLDDDYLLWYDVPMGPRNTHQILHTASLVAADLLTADDKDDDGIPLLKPVSCGREGQEPLIIKLPSLQAEAEAIADHLAQAHKEGFAWGDMAVLCADTKTRDLCARTLAQRKLPVENRLGVGDFDPTSNKIKVMTMKVSKGLEFPLVALPGMGHMPAAGEDEKEAARVFYVAATRATHFLLLGVGGNGDIGLRIQKLHDLST